MNQTQTSTKPRLFKKSKSKSEPKIPAVKPLKKKKIKVQKPKGEVVPAKKTTVIRPQFPNISQVIPEPVANSASVQPSGFQFQSVNSYLKWAVVIILIVLSGAWNYFVILSFSKTFASWSTLLVKREKLAEQMALWENIAKEYPTYRDAYVEGARYAYELGDRGKEEYFLSKLQLLDPNFPLAKTLEQLMSLQTKTNN